MKMTLKLIIITLALSALIVSCAKKPLTLDENTPMKALLKASDKEITDFVIKEAVEKGNLNAEDISVEYILRDKKNQAIVVKSKINQE